MSISFKEMGRQLVAHIAYLFDWHEEAKAPKEIDDGVCIPEVCLACGCDCNEREMQQCALVAAERLQRAELEQAFKKRQNDEEWKRIREPVSADCNQQRKVNALLEGIAKNTAEFLAANARMQDRQAQIDLDCKNGNQKCHECVRYHCSDNTNPTGANISKPAKHQLDHDDEQEPERFDLN